MYIVEINDMPDMNGLSQGNILVKIIIFVGNFLSLLVFTILEVKYFK